MSSASRVVLELRCGDCVAEAGRRGRRERAPPNVEVAVLGASIASRSGTLTHTTGHDARRASPRRVRGAPNARASASSSSARRPASSSWPSARWASAASDRQGKALGDVVCACVKCADSESPRESVGDSPLCDPQPATCEAGPRQRAIPSLPLRRMHRVPPPLRQAPRSTSARTSTAPFRARSSAVPGAPSPRVRSGIRLSGDQVAASVREPAAVGQAACEQAAVAGRRASAIGTSSSGRSCA